MNTAPGPTDILSAIYAFYQSWASDQLDLVCRKGCAACCTRNVTMTEPEGEYILAGLPGDEQRTWLGEHLENCGTRGRPQLTTNDWAVHCLRGEECDDPSEQVLEPCPFLDAEQSCQIYALRPFACRCFGSSVDCSKAGTASQPNRMLEVNTVTMQLIEHLGRERPWGNMLDLLSLLLLQAEPRTENAPELKEIRQHLRTAAALPGFLIMPNEQGTVQNYLAELLQVQVKGQTIRQLLGFPS